MPFPAFRSAPYERMKANYPAAVAMTRSTPAGVFGMEAAPLLGLFATSNIKRALGNLDLFLAYLEELQVFDNANTRALLEPVGIQVPKVESYLDRVLDYYHARRSASARVPNAAENEVRTPS